MVRAKGVASRPKAHSEGDAVIKVIAVGATGCLQKHSCKEELLCNVRDAVDCEDYIPRDAMRRVLAETYASPQ